MSKRSASPIAGGSPGSRPRHRALSPSRGSAASSTAAARPAASAKTSAGAQFAAMAAIASGCAETGSGAMQAPAARTPR